MTLFWGFGAIKYNYVGHHTVFGIVFDSLQRSAGQTSDSGAPVPLSPPNARPQHRLPTLVVNFHGHSERDPKARKAPPQARKGFPENYRKPAKAPSKPAKQACKRSRTVLQVHPDDRQIQFLPWISGQLIDQGGRSPPC